MKPVTSIRCSDGDSYHRFRRKQSDDLSTLHQQDKIVSTNNSGTTNTNVFSVTVAPQRSTSPLLRTSSSGAEASSPTHFSSTAIRL
uniref:Uncharacterized protein n=1 Tax=Syphacia muris TaxID=451379 RepID=A0A0N5AYX7_9BILA